VKKPLVSIRYSRSQHECLGGAKGTCVPVHALFENLESGATVAEFIQWFPGVTREQVEAVLEHAQRSLVEA